MTLKQVPKINGGLLSLYHFEITDFQHFDQDRKR